MFCLYLENLVGRICKTLNSGGLAQYRRVQSGQSRFRDALAALRIKPGQGFFPRPDEVAAEIEAGMDARRTVQDRERQARRRATEVEEFWRWALEWMEFTGNAEEELLRRFPSFRGTKPDARR